MLSAFWSPDNCLCLYSHNAAVRISPVLLTPGGALAPLGRLHALGGTLLGAASRVPFEPLALNNEQWINKNTGHVPDTRSEYWWDRYGHKTSKKCLNFIWPSLYLSWALVVGGLVHALLGAGGVVAHGHEGGGSKPLAAWVGHLVLGKEIYDPWKDWRNKGIPWNFVRTFQDRAWSI